MKLSEELKDFFINKTATKGSKGSKGGEPYSIVVPPYMWTAEDIHNYPEIYNAHKELYELGATHFTTDWVDKFKTIKIALYKADAFGVTQVFKENKFAETVIDAKS